jgi:Leucine-rich repeat (LRR) protein
LIGIEVLDPDQPVTVGGDHVAGRSNADVTIVQIRNSNTPFVIQQIFSAFPNLANLEISDSNLQELSLSPSAQLEHLELYDNNLARIVNGTFAGQSRLSLIEAMDNKIEEIEVAAFEGLESLAGLVLIGNRIRELTPGTFNGLANLVYLDLTKNRLERIEDNVFAGLPQLSSLLLTFNSINEVSPTFTNSLSSTVKYLYFESNRCIDRLFVLRESIDIILLNNALNPCFNNFIGEVPETKRITF